MEKGIYTLVLRLDSDITICVGARGQIRFQRGYYAYTGSARGSGGLKRIKRHLRVMDGSNSARRWHIDYLLPHTSLVEVVVTKTHKDLECSIAQKIGERLSFIPRFGCTDCKCLSHLHYSEYLDEMLGVIRHAHADFSSVI